MKQATRGTYAGAWMANSVLQQGGIYGALKEQGIEAPATALVFGGAAAAAETAADLLLLKRFFPNANDVVLSGVRDYAKHVGRGMVSQGLVEGTAEGASEVIQLAAFAVADPDFEVSALSNRTQVINALAAGAAVGVAFGGIGSSVGGAVDAYRGYKDGQREQEVEDGSPPVAPGVASTPRGEAGGDDTGGPSASSEAPGGSLTGDSRPESQADSDKGRVDGGVVHPAGGEDAGVEGGDQRPVEGAGGRGVRLDGGVERGRNPAIIHRRRRPRPPLIANPWLP